MNRWLLALLLLSYVSGVEGSELPSVPGLTSAVSEGEVSPEELGAVVSAIAFADVCQSIRNMPSELANAKPLEVAFAQVVGEFCRGMVVAVASTMRAGQPYRIDAGEVCIDPELSPDKVIDHIKLQIDNDRQPFIGTPAPQVDTPAAIRRSIQALSPCG